MRDASITYGRFLGLLLVASSLQACNFLIDLDSYTYMGPGEDTGVDDGFVDMPADMTDMPVNMPPDLPEPADMMDMPADANMDMDMDMEIIVDLPTGPGEVFFTELLVNTPGVLEDGATREPGEFVELYNKGPTSLDLKDTCLRVVFEDSGDEPPRTEQYLPFALATIPGDVLMPPGSYAIFVNGVGKPDPEGTYPQIAALLDNIPVNTQVFYIGTESGLFSNSAPRSLEVFEGALCDGELLDRISWDKTFRGNAVDAPDTFPYLSQIDDEKLGVSWSLASSGYESPMAEDMAGDMADNTTEHTTNDTTEHWCLAVQENTYDGGVMRADPGRAFQGMCEKTNQ